MFNEKPVTIAIDKAKCKKCRQFVEICPITRVIGFDSLEDGADIEY
jgi:ferredoxin